MEKGYVVCFFYQAVIMHVHNATTLLCKMKTMVKLLIYILYLKIY